MFENTDYDMISFAWIESSSLLTQNNALIMKKIQAETDGCRKQRTLTVDHLGSHPVRVSHHGVSLSPVGFLDARDRSGRQLVLVLVLHHEPGQAEVRHHNTVILSRAGSHLQICHLSLF